MRADRGGRRRVWRKRAFVLAAVAVILLAAAIMVLGPWGVFSDVLFSKAGGTGKTPMKRGSHGQPPRAAGSNGGGSYFWVTLKLPTSPQRYSDTRKPVVAIIVDDTGNSSSYLASWQKIRAPLTFSVFPWPPMSGRLANALYADGYQVMMHVPTDNMPPRTNAGPGQLSTGMSKAQVFQTLDADASTVPFISGMNNHEGGRGCDQLDLMTYEVEWANSKGLYVVDSASSTHSMVTQACLSLGLPRRLREVFIDHQNDPAYIRSAMNQLADLARKNGTAIGICHWHRPNTPTTVGEMIATLRAQGIHFAFVKDISD